jgi:23S rRNA pseudouridine1911/1915/1917 synthase
LVLQGHQRIDCGDEIEIDYMPQPIKQTRRNSKRVASERFEVVHDDEQLVVVNKPAGLLTVPTPKREANTLQSQVRKWLDKQQPQAMAICVHRLDRGVSGLLVFAKSIETADRLRDQFAARKPDRRYVAIVQGELETAQGTYQSYLATDSSLNRYSVSDPTGGELAITHYKVLERWRGVTLVEVRLETGRRNQIRVHFAEAGHPVIGDPRYRAELAEHPAWPHKRLALHAESLGFSHPTTAESLTFISPWPQEYRDFRRQQK